MTISRRRSAQANALWCPPGACTPNRPEGVAFVSGRRRNGGPLTSEAFVSDLRREGFEVVHGGQKAGYVGECHAHDFDVENHGLGW